MSQNHPDTKKARALAVRLRLVTSAVVLVATAFFFDSAVLAWFSKQHSRAMETAASAISRWGDWPPMALVFCSVFLIATACRSRKVARVALVALLASSLSGASASAVRLLTGRARPSAKIEAGWYGPHIGSHKLSSFPSAHTAAVAGASVALGMLVPWTAIPGASLVLLMAWARMRTGSHHLSDVAAGAVLGGMIAAWLVSRIPAHWPPHGWYAANKRATRSVTEIETLVAKSQV